MLDDAATAPHASIPASERTAASEGEAVQPSAPPAPDASNALTGRLAEVAGDLEQVATDGLRPAAMTVGILFTVFAINNWIRYPPGVRVAVVSYDVALVVLGFTVYSVCRRTRLSARSSHLAAAALSFSVLGQITLTTLSGVNPLFSFFIAILLIASAGAVLSLAWIIAIIVVGVATWAALANAVLDAYQFEQNTLVIIASAAVAFIVYFGRTRAWRRILALRSGDARRELALQRALADADDARRGLDRKVLERTAALRKELDERERLEAQLRHAQKLEAVGQLAGGIAHDFNNLLTVIRMSHLAISGSGTSADELRDAMRDASDATDRAASLTHDLLAFARKQTLERTTLAVGEILGVVERMMRRFAEAGIRFEVRVAPDAGEVVADRHQIEQVLLNLAINACDAMGKRGTLSIAADLVEHDAGDAARLRIAPGPYVQIAVTDTGAGMDEATRRAVFEPFFTTKEVGRGSGLGLSVAHGIVTQHGGAIEVDSELGKGSTFTVHLPWVRGEPAARAAATVEVSAAVAGETLLVVEDEAAVRRAVERNLRRLGYRVITACDGEDALQLAEGLDAVDLVLTDVVMPGIDGPELVCRLRERWHDVAVLFVTGYSADRLERSGAVGTHDRVLEKPYQFPELTSTIRQMLDARGPRATISA